MPSVQAHRQAARLARFAITGFLVTLSICSLPAHAITYGIFDARTMAMGGAAVAAAESDSAVFYNASLLSYNDEIEEKTRDGRFMFPLVIGELSNSVLDTFDFSDNDPDDTLTNSVNQFNANQDQANAQAVANAAAGMRNALNDIGSNDLVADTYAGFAASEPSKHKGAGFFFGARVVGGGSSSVSPADINLLNDYEEGLTFVATNGAQGVAHPELFNASGALQVPDAQFTSSQNARGAVIGETGVGIARQFQVRERPVAFSITPKILRVEVFDNNQRIVDGRIGVRDNRETHTLLNFDAGFSMDYSENTRIGFAIKDVIPRRYGTALGNAIKLRPRSRIGIAHLRHPFLVALDVDLYRNQPLGTEAGSQEIAFGTEWFFRHWLRVRGGYRYDLAGNRGGAFSAGAGLAWRRFLFDFVIATGSESQAGGFQFGYTF